MAERILTLHELNRATLARQLLLERVSLSSLDALEHLVGLQAQVPSPPYIGLWTRLQSFQRSDLTYLLEHRQAVRATMMRSTLHLMTATDYMALRPVLQPVLTRALHGFFLSRYPMVESGPSQAVQPMLRRPRGSGIRSLSLYQVNQQLYVSSFSAIWRHLVRRR